MAFRELLRTNDPVLLSFVEALLREGGIGHVVLDANMSVLEGSIGILPRRVLVDADAYRQAVRTLTDAGLDKELSEQHLAP
ncbi:MAG: hypothetical protein BroJett030_21510 [Alphaproteobacteria bacterium]|nr:MAG: hypothetical protein BroJett030_21510 [Alphaproteobacteria bacterium]